MPFVEETASIFAPRYEKVLTYFFDDSLPGNGAFRYSFDAGSLKCSQRPAQQSQVCLVSPAEMSALGHETPAYVYADNGCWSDNADGKGAKRRDFVLVCGPHVYLCEYSSNPTDLKSKVASVETFFSHFKSLGRGIKVLGYQRAIDTLPQSTTDPNLYLFLGDLHLPPVSWFYNRMTLAVFNGTRTPPAWLTALPAFQRQPDSLMRNYFSISEVARENGSVPQAQGPTGGNPDIYGKTETDLVNFIDGLASLPPAIKGVFHFIQTGDMFELWLGRDYQYQEGRYDPHLISPQSPNIIADWCLEIMIQNIRLFEALRRLENSGLREVKYLWGNHDAYMKEKSVTRQLGIPDRDPSYRGLSGDLFADHGHKFDDSNHDNTAYWFKGPWGADMAFAVPVFRQLEKPVRVLTSLGSSNSERDFYLQGTSLMFLAEKYDRKIPPFAIYVMGHTHDRKLFRFNIKAEYHLYG
jgi:UDP-2,3-diacylglucosamine pyrophosphatase LpxH